MSEVIHGIQRSITCTFTLFAGYSSQQAIIDEAVIDGCVLYTTAEGCTIPGTRVHCSIRDLVGTNGVFPSQIHQMVAGFGVQSPADRIAVIQKYVSLGGDINGQHGALLLSAMSRDLNDILVALFDLGARVCSDDGNLYMRAGTSVFGIVQNGDSNTKNVLTLLNHLAHTDYTHAMGSIIDYRRLDIFKELKTMPESSVDDYVTLIMKCIAHKPDFISGRYHTPKCVAVNAALLIRHGVSVTMSSEFAKYVQAEHLRNTTDIQEKLARLQKLEEVFKRARID